MKLSLICIEINLQVENIFRHMDMMVSRFVTKAKGNSEIAFYVKGFYYELHISNGSGYKIV